MNRLSILLSLTRLCPLHGALWRTSWLAPTHFSLRYTSRWTHQDSDSYYDKNAYRSQSLTKVRTTGRISLPVARRYSTPPPVPSDHQGSHSNYSWGTVFGFVSVGFLVFYVKMVRRYKESVLEKKRQESVNLADVGHDFSLVSTEGKLVTKADLRGRWLLMYFGFTHCPDICPDELEKIGLVIDRLTGAGRKVQPIFVSVDHERDTPEVVAKYLEEIHPSFIGLTGNQEQIDGAVSSFRAYYKIGEKDSQGDYLVDHTIISYLINPQGQFVDYYGRSADANKMVDSISRHMKLFSN